jgi:hypothetical protein
MPPPQQKEKSSYLIEMRHAANLLFFITDAHAMCILPFTRSHMGKRGVGAAGFWAMIGIALYAGTMNAPEMITYWYVWLCMCIYRRIFADRNQHTQYRGWVWAFDWCVRDELTARRLEVAAVFALGIAVMEWSQAIGQFLVYGSFSLGVQSSLAAMHRTRRLEAAHNARLEMETMQQQFVEERRSR